VVSISNSSRQYSRPFYLLSFVSPSPSAYASYSSLLMDELIRLCLIGYSCFIKDSAGTDQTPAYAFQQTHLGLLLLLRLYNTRESRLRPFVAVLQDHLYLR